MFDIASQLKNFRQKKGYSQIDVFNKTGVHNKTLSGYERGVSTPDIETLRTLLIFYEASADDFFMMPKLQKSKDFQLTSTTNDMTQIKLLDIYASLETRDQNTILKMAETLLASNSTQDESLIPKKGA